MRQQPQGEGVSLRAGGLWVWKLAGGLRFFRRPLARRFLALGPPPAPHRPTAGAQNPLLRQRRFLAHLRFLFWRVRPSSRGSQTPGLVRDWAQPWNSASNTGGGGGEFSPKKAPRASCQLGGCMTHFPEGAPRLSSRCRLPAAKGLTLPLSTLGWPAVAHSDGWVGGGGWDRPRHIVLGNELENAFRRQIRPSPLSWP
jgi:hypothetical protein